MPQGAQLIDLSQQWVIPGLMDAHTHITMNLPPAPQGISAWEDYLAHESTALRALEGLHMAGDVLQAGITTIRDVGNPANYADTALRQAIEKGWFVGPTIINAGKIIAPFGGQSHDVAPEQGRMWDFEYIDADNPAEIRKAVHENIFYGAKVIKLVADNNPYFYTEEDIRAAADEAHRAGLKLAVHVYGGQAATNVINGGADSVEHGWDLTDDQLRLMKQKGTFLAGTDFPYEHAAAWGGMVPLKAREVADKVQDRLARAYRIGVKLAFSTDTVVNLAGKNRGQMSMDFLAVWTKASVPAPDILKAMTTNCAELLGVQKERGAIATGPVCGHRRHFGESATGHPGPAQCCVRDEGRSRGEGGEVGFLKHGSRTAHVSSLNAGVKQMNRITRTATFTIAIIVISVASAFAQSAQSTMGAQLAEF